MSRRRGSGPVGVQREKDFFRAASRNMQLTLWIIRGIAVFMLFLLVSSIVNILNEGVWDFKNLESLAIFVILLFFVFVLALLTLVSYVAVPLNVGNSAIHYFLASRAFVTNEIFGNVRLLDSFDADVFFGASTDPFGPMAYLLNKPQKEIYNPIIMKGIIMFGVIMIIVAGIGFVRKSSVNLGILTLIISQATIGLAYLKGFVTNLSFDNSSIPSLLSSGLFQLALVSYLYLEFTLQTGYLYSLTTPTLSRQERVGKQLARLSEFRLGITKLGVSEDQKEVKEVAKELGEEEEKRESTALAMGSGSTAARKFSADALIFLLDSAQDSLFAKPGGEQERLTGRLQRYHDGLLQHDKKLDDKLGGSAEKAFRPLTILMIVVGSFFIRMVLLVFLSWLILKPEILLTFIALPLSITYSLEIGQPEGILLVLIPVVFLIIGGSYLITKIQAFITTQQELIIKEADIGRVLKAGRSLIGKDGKSLSKEDLERQLAMEDEAKKRKRKKSAKESEQSESPKKPKKKATTRKRPAKRPRKTKK